MNSYYCVVCKKWIYQSKYYLSRKTRRWVSKDNTVSKDEHMIMHGWCKLCDKEIPRQLHCVLKHRCRKSKAGCLLRYESLAVSLKRHLKENKHRWRKDIVIKENPEYHEPHMQDIDRQCAKCGWNVNICEPHYKGSNSIEQKGINKLVYDAPPVKPKFEDHYDTKPIKADYKPGGKLNPKGKIATWDAEYKDDLKTHKVDVTDFEEQEMQEWKDAMSIHVSNRIQPYYGVNHYHSWCKNE